MKVPMTRIVLFAACIGGGVVLDRYLLPASRDEGKGSPGNAGGSPSAVAGSASAGPGAAREANKPFTGTVADLIRISRQINDYQRGQLKISQVLQLTPVADIGRLTASFPWRYNLPWQESVVYEVLLAQWADLDPAAALAWAGTLTNPRLAQVRSQVLNAWARKEPEKALALARKISNASERDAALEGVANAIAATDPRRALSLMSSVKSRNGDYRYYTLFTSWAASDPAAAHAAARNMPPGPGRTYALRAVFGTWGAEDPAAAHAAAMAMPDSGARQQAIQSVFESWASSDPQGALAAFKAVPKGQMRIETLGRIFATWAGSDPNAAAAAVTGLSRNERMNAISQISSVWASTDHQAALAWAKTLPPKEGGEYAISNVLGNMARADGPAAAAVLQDLPATLRRSQLSQVVDNWANYDREGALAYARSLDRPQDKAAALAACVNRMDFSEATEINAILAELPQGQQRQQALRSLAENRAYYDPGGTLDWLATLSENDRNAALRNGSLYQLASGDPKKAAEILKSTPELASQPGQWGAIASQLASEDPLSALAWAEAVETPAARKQSIDRVMESWARENGPDALAKAQSLSDPAQKKSAIASVINTWADQDPDAVLKWAEGATGEEREIALLRASIRKAGDDPVTSAAVVDKLLAGNPGDKTPTRFADAAGGVARDWFSQDTAAATTWAMHLPEGDARESAVQAIVEAWTSLDSMAASQWVQQLPPGRSRDFAAQRLSEGIAQSDPESAFTWAASIGDDSKRDDAVRRAVQTWGSIDESAAVAAVMQARISDNVRKSLLEQFEKRE
ncbi:MAG TPA: hypothetical protein VHM91_18180 [Verrucomicrobiales bacterium]|nr:hypothetical protein [Verrucomicrobiales bacterium]